MRTAVTIAVFSCLLMAGAALAGDSLRTESAGLRFSVPSEWTRVPAASEMRQAQFRIPRAAGDSEDGELVLFHFENGQGGSVQDNLDRWLAQLKQPDGSAAKDKATTVIRPVKTLKATSLDASGDYTGMGDKTAKPGWRLLGAVIEGPGGPWFFKAVGPQATIEAAKSGFDALVNSVEPHK